MPNALHHLCAFHKLDRNLTSHRRFKSLINQCSDPNDRAEWEALVDWLWSICKHCETEREVDCSLMLLNAYLDECPGKHMGFIGEPLVQELKDFILNSFAPEVNRLSLEGVSSLPATRNSARKKKRKKRPHEK